jgi:uridine phosphorylase
LYDRAVWENVLDIEQRARCITIGSYQGHRVGVLAPTLGGPAAAMALDAAASRGVRNVLGLGFCGGIASELSCGDLLLPLAAVAADGASQTYAPERFPAVADPDLLAAARAADPAARVGLVWSGDGVLTQDDAFARRCAQLGVAGVDMETAAVLTVARLRGVRALTTLVVSDHLGQCRPTDVGQLGDGVTAATGLVLGLVAHAARLA